MLETEGLEVEAAERTFSKRNAKIKPAENEASPKVERRRICDHLPDVDVRKKKNSNSSYPRFHLKCSAFFRLKVDPSLT